METRRSQGCLRKAGMSQVAARRENFPAMKTPLRSLLMTLLPSPEVADNRPSIRSFVFSSVCPFVVRATDRPTLALFTFRRLEISLRFLSTIVRLLHLNHLLCELLIDGSLSLRLASTKTRPPPVSARALRSTWS